MAPTSRASPRHPRSIWTPPPRRTGHGSHSPPPATATTRFTSWPAAGPARAGLAFAVEAPEGSGLSAMNVEGWGLSAIATEPGLSDTPAWSPDGSRLVYEHATGPFQDGLNFQVVVAGPDGSNPVRVTEGP